MEVWKVNQFRQSRDWIQKKSNQNAEDLPKRNWVKSLLGLNILLEKSFKRFAQETGY
jgi:hypothetical protein